MRRTAIAVAVLLFGIQAQAGIITQTSELNFASHGGFGAKPYNQLDPSLAPLNAVVFTVTLDGPGEGLGPTGRGDSYLVTNPTSNTISFNAMLQGIMYSNDAEYGFSASSTVPVTLGPNESTFLLSFQLPPFGIQVTRGVTMDLGQYVGTGILTPLFFESDNVSVDNSLITVSNRDAFKFTGTETITYYYGSTFLMPEPASLTVLSLGLAAVAGLTWHRRRAKFGKAAEEPCAALRPRQTLIR
jgi:hypothetical protein